MHVDAQGNVHPPTTAKPSRHEQMNLTGLELTLRQRIAVAIASAISEHVGDEASLERRVYQAIIKAATKIARVFDENDDTIHVMANDFINEIIMGDNQE